MRFGFHRLGFEALARAGPDLELNHVLLRAAIHVDIVNHDGHGIFQVEAADWLEDQAPSRRSRYVIEEGSRDARRVESHAEASLVPRSLWRCRHRVLVTCHDLVARQYLKLLVLAQRHEVLRNRQVGLLVASGQRHLLDPRRYALEAMDRHPHQSRLGIRGKGDLNPTRYIGNAGSLGNQRLHTRGEIRGGKHAVGSRRSVDLDHGLARRKLIGTSMAPHLDLVEAGRQFTFNDKRGVRFLVRRPPVEQEDCAHVRVTAHLETAHRHLRLIEQGAILPQARIAGVARVHHGEFLCRQTWHIGGVIAARRAHRTQLHLLLPVSRQSASFRAGDRNAAAIRGERAYPRATIPRRHILRFRIACTCNPVATVERRLQHKMRDRLVFGQPLDRHFVQRDVIIHVYTKDARLFFVADIAQPAWIVPGTDRHIRVTAGRHLGRKGHGLGTGRRNDTLELTRVGTCLFQQ